MSRPTVDASVAPDPDSDPDSRAKICAATDTQPAKLTGRSAASPWVPVILVLVMSLVCMIEYRGLVARDQIKPAPNQTKIDINHADAATLELLPMIGPSLSRRIVDYRTEHGPFTNVEQLIKVKRIGPVTLARLRPLIECGLPER